LTIAGLQHVQTLRHQQAADADLRARVHAIKSFQQARFIADYADFLKNPRYRAAAEFFLRELYGPADFANRDAQFSRIVPTLSRLLPEEVLKSVASMAQLHALTEALDQVMAEASPYPVSDDGSYRQAWRTVGRREDRERQLGLLLEIGTAIERHTRSALLKPTLRMMRAPARAAGFEQLQVFLEAGLAAFAAMGDAKDFLDTIARNERRVIDRYFA
jgi:hypothetical protein